MSAPAELMDAPDDLVQGFAAAAGRREVTIAEVGAWLHNPIHPDPSEAAHGIRQCQRALELADRVGALCAVNIAGSRHPTQWDGPHPENLSRETFDAIVESTRRIVDGVRPARARYVLETMPWIYPDSPESYLELLKAIDRKEVGVHLDIANMMNCPARIFRAREFIHHCFNLLGPHIVAMHAKDVAYEGGLTFHVNEVPWGQGVMDLRAFLLRASRLETEVPVGLEHLPFECYAPAVAHIRAVGRELGLSL